MRSPLAIRRPCRPLRRRQRTLRHRRIIQLHVPAHPGTLSFGCNFHRDNRPSFSRGSSVPPAPLLYPTYLIPSDQPLHLRLRLQALHATQPRAHARLHIARARAAPGSCAHAHFYRRVRALSRTRRSHRQCPRNLYYSAPSNRT
jgi:hypothetical protein